ncbi:DgyrCDS14899 [Dimorphilus gyrociliatus]|uniref:DgyrCDS14899 n=1 Tax=Dimorphilus gyrociliatus TaxID=2664684 RepID=A0A7I8WFJ5_9ANNE|nr:DgyrCDS14899 [Dimorphilus gyrociliatus]
MLKDIFIFLQLAIHMYSLPSEEDNLIRNNPSYQSTTNLGSLINVYWAYKANDDRIFFGHVNNIYEGSYTSRNIPEKSWWMVDLRNSYEVTSVCVANRAEDGHYNDYLKSFKIFTKLHPNDNEGKYCNERGSTPIPKAIHNPEVDYVCFDCPSNPTGSFVEIIQTIVGSHFGMCDVKIFGNLKSERDFQVIDLSNSKLFENHLNINHLRDFNLATEFEKSSSKDIFFRIDFQSIIKVKGLMIIGSQYDDSEMKFTNVYISVSNTPHTTFNRNLVFLIENYIPNVFAKYKTHKLFSNTTVSGRYLLMNIYNPNVLDFKISMTELTVYGHTVGQIRGSKLHAY